MGQTHVRAMLLIQQIGVTAGSRQAEFVIDNPIDDQPIGLDMDIAPTFPIALERMIPEARWKGVACKQQTQQRAQFS